MADGMGTKTQRLAAAEMIRMMERFQWNMANRATIEEKMSWKWRDIRDNRSTKKRTVSLRVDDDVYRRSRSTGPGYGPRMNNALGAFARARLAGLLEGEDLPARDREAWMGKPEPPVAGVERA
ncbi:MAG: BrnA antitoxin family protein [Pseudomonadota bacterium]